MNLNLKTILVGGLMLAALPGVLGQATPLQNDANHWGMKGEEEPSTLLDHDTTLMWQGADRNPSTSVNHVYFNAYMTQPVGYSVNVDPNFSPNFASLSTGWPGYPYVAHALRDVDCFDESVKVLRDASISWGTPTSSLCV